ncbi:AMP-binding protein, partial [Haloplanus sp.]|uniref:AMP-binding protein n=1 Tax=Haloplanus sp. TaxID=1961696 RepID=UPI00260A35E9
MPTEREQRTGSVVYHPSREFVESTNVHRFMQAYDIDDYDELIERTTTTVPGEPRSGVDWFWDELVDYLDIEFDEGYDAVRNDAEGPQFTDWYPGGRLNAAHNALDRHADVASDARNRVACLWEGEPGEVREVTYHDLGRGANRVANYLDARGVGVGDTVALYMPMVPEVAAILYGCFKIGAVAVPVFSGFGVDAAATRIADAEPTVLFTGDGFYRRGDHVLLKGDADAAVEEAGHVEHTVVFDRLGLVDAGEVPWNDDRDERWEQAIGERDPDFETRSLPSDAESMLLYSSGTTGTPKGIVHTHAGALIQAAKEVYFGMDLKPADRFFWVSDIGWMMGPWSLLGTHTHGGTVVMYEGAPDHPEPDRFWRLIDDHGVTQFGISPTAIRALRKHGDGWVEGYDLSTLR